ncbi:MAG TPA: acyl-CoA reductase [Bacteroidia bacterium]|jgi:hypothetical protein|nr:acyl-CoA reductase [Bacteroidia bacterium]
MTLDNRIEAFSALGEFLKQVGQPKSTVPSTAINDLFYNDFEELIKQVAIYNPWFTEQNTKNAIAAIAENLDKNALQTFVAPYREQLLDNKKERQVAVIMAGNIPLVGFHDFLCVLLSGNRFIGKLSSDDNHLLPFVAKILIHIAPAFAEYVEFTEGQLKNMQAVIATGSNNTARYFEYYFNKYATIIRKNRNSVAVLTGKESKEELNQLGQDIFQYFGLGCRNVSKLFVPKGYTFDLFYESILDFKDIINVNKYANNYDYNRTVYLMSSEPNLFDNNFLLLKESDMYASPIGVLFYEYYDDVEQLNKRLENDAEQIQCIVSADSRIKKAIPFGKAQCPALNDYADGLDTMKFLLS